MAMYSRAVVAVYQLLSACRPWWVHTHFLEDFVVSQVFQNIVDDLSLSIGFLGFLVTILFTDLQCFGDWFSIVFDVAICILLKFFCKILLMYFGPISHVMCSLSQCIYLNLFYSFAVGNFEMLL